MYKTQRVVIGASEIYSEVDPPKLRIEDRDVKELIYTRSRQQGWINYFIDTVFFSCFMVSFIMMCG